jgi:hypothetical protein
MIKLLTCKKINGIFIYNIVLTILLYILSYILNIFEYVLQILVYW